ncbi:MAG: zf-HC2 domain-containing protein, partial [Acidobacteria bacterium]|nr:zf-HC2 domain-containing protein [Acidobacteriota bacterium]
MRDEHFEYEQIVSYVDGRPGDEDREILDEHLKLCGRCREDVQSFVMHRQQIEPELKIRYAPSEKQPKRRHFVGWWESLNFPLKPAYAAYALLLVSSLVAVTTLLRRGRSTETPFHSATPIVNVTPTSAPNATSTPIPTPTENTIASQSSVGTDKHRGEPGDRRPLYRKTPTGAEPTNWRDSEKLAVSLRDGGRQISLDDTGNLVGLEDLPASNRRLVKETLSSGELQRPVILNDLAVEKSSTRSNTFDQPSFKLISPGQAVIVETKPVFKWEPLNGALGYKVYIASRANWAGMASPTLDSSTFEWIPPTRLRRGETYTWVVSAITEKGELTVPASSEPERKFKVLGERDFNALIRLKRNTSSHLMLGLFYAR